MAVTVNWILFPSAEDVALESARRIEAAAATCIEETGVFKIVLAGGSTPVACYKHLVHCETDWRCWQVYFGDERCLPADDQDRNSVIVSHAWLDQVEIPRKNIHPISAETGADQAADEYEALIRSALPFDLVLLGIGEDGHTASLFPGHVNPQERLVVPVHNAPKPPPDRVSLSPGALSSSDIVIVLVTGVSKRSAVANWQAGRDIPIQHLSRQISMDVLIDQDALPE